jgi:hypothetical protein
MTAARLIDPHAHISAGPQFTNDGKAMRENGADNLWVQPLDGSAKHQITKFDT